MDRIDASRADIGICIYLVLIAAGAALIACFLYWLMLPRVLQNPGPVGYRTSVPAPVLWRDGSDLRAAERLSIATARKENERQRIAESTAFAKADLAASQDAKPTVAKPTVAKPPKPKTVVRMQKRQPLDPQRAWAFGGDRAFGGFWLH